MTDILVVHDVFRERGGGEYIGKTIHETFPDSDLATLYWNPEKFSSSEIRAAQAPGNGFFLERLPESARIPLYPLLADRIDAFDYDIVLSSGAWAKGVRTSSETFHISYIYTPLRFAWDPYHLQRMGPIKSAFISLIRKWEVSTAKNPDIIFAISENVARRIRRFYRREARVLYPPVPTEKFYPDKSKGFYLIVSRLHPKKKVVEVARVFEDMEENLVIAGDGPLRQEVEKISSRNDNIEYKGYVEGDEKFSLYSSCEALIFPAYDEDFGLTPIEANASGKPVIAINQGGVTETQSEETAVFFNDWSEEEVKRAINSYKNREFDPEKIQRNSEKFSSQRFKKALREVVEE